MTLPTKPRSRARAVRVSVLVSEEEGNAIKSRADAAGLSVSAYLRLCALADGTDANPQVLAQVDQLIADMEAALDTATAALETTLGRLDTVQTSCQRTA